MGLMSKIVISTLLACHCLLGLTACQKPDEAAEPVKPAVTQSTTRPAPDPLLDVTTLKASYSLPACASEGCAQVDIQRLETGKAWINQFLDQKILELSYVQLNEQPAKITTLQASVDRFVQAARQASIADGEPVPYSMQVTPEFLGEKGTIALFKISVAFYTGGAHGSALDHYYNLDLKQKKALKLSDIVLAEQQPKLHELVQQQYTDWIKKNDSSADLAKDQQQWPFQLGDNFTFAEQGMVFAQYEIGPDVLGLPEITVPYAQLAGIIKPEYLTAPLQLQPAQPLIQQNASTSAN